MMKWGMEILAPYSNWFLGENKSTKWTQQENKLFENALAIYDKDTPDRWQKVADMIPGKTVMDVYNQYKELVNDVSDIEAGLVPLPGYNTSSFAFDCIDEHGVRQSYGCGMKRPSAARTSDHERKKGVPWTEEEHKLFLLGLKKYGKGDWRNISRTFVVTRTPTQVASHAQKYFIRQHSCGKDKRRSSIHDITTANCEDSPTLDDNRAPSPDQTTVFSQSSQPQRVLAEKSNFEWSQPHSRANMIFRPTYGSHFMPITYGINSNEMNFPGQNHRGGIVHRSHVISQSTIVPMQHFQCQPNG